MAARILRVELEVITVNSADDFEVASTAQGRGRYWIFTFASRRRTLQRAKSVLMNEIISCGESCHGSSPAVTSRFRTSGSARGLVDVGVQPRDNMGRRAFWREDANHVALSGNSTKGRTEETDCGVGSVETGFMARG